MDPRDLVDTREGADVEWWAQSHLRSCKPWLIRAVQKSRNLSTPPEHSWLGRVDTRTAPFQTSELVRLFIQVAVDNLMQVDRVLETSLPPFALYSMVRSAIESASLALWILDAKSEDPAASRTLRIYRQNVESDRKLWATVSGRASGPHDHFVGRIEAVHAALKGVEHSSLTCAVKSTDVISATDVKHPSQSAELDIFAGLEVWRLCSAVTHANQVSLLNILERHPDGALGEPATRTSRFSIVAATYSTALHRTNSLISKFEARSAPRRTGP